MQAMSFESIEVVLPGWRRRAMGLVALAVVGGLMAYVFPNSIGLGSAVFPIMALSLLAGLSALWSP